LRALAHLLILLPSNRGAAKRFKKTAAKKPAAEKKAAKPKAKKPAAAVYFFTYLIFFYFQFWRREKIWHWDKAGFRFVNCAINNK
jgi:hypothetical protein